MSSQREEDLVTFYSILGELEKAVNGPRTLRDCCGRMGWPARGVYFFRETGEDRSDSGVGPRVVRVGTHAITAGSSSTLLGRLRQHKGTGSGGGNHRGSVFRDIVGFALIRRDGLHGGSWKDKNADRAARENEVELEQSVSKVLGEMTILWLKIEDEPSPDSLRSYVERNSIALLSNYDKSPLDQPSSGWLGHNSDRELVRASGLWNQNHVRESYDPGFLQTFAQLVKEMAGQQ